MVVLAAMAVATRGMCANSSGADDPLLDLFIQKGFVTQEEAEKVKAEAAAMQTNQTNELQMPQPAGSPWKFSKGIKNIGFVGDVRLRYEDRSAGDPKNGNIDLRRLRYSIRLGLRGELFDDYYYGFRIEPSSSPRSSWLTMGTAASGTPYQGPFGKSTAGVNVGQAYLGWHHWDWLEITLGKMPNPLYTTPMVWSSSVNPEGAAEHLKYPVGPAEFFANLGQFIYQDTNPNKASLGYFPSGSPDVYTGGSSSTFLLAWQGGVEYQLTRQISFKVAPVLYVYTAKGVDTSSGTPGFSDTYVGQGASNPSLAGYDGYGITGNNYYDGFSANQTGINDLKVLEIPFQLDFKNDRLNARLFGDFVYNLDGANRAQAAYNVALAESQPTFTYPNGNIPPYFTTPISSPQTHDDKAYQIGIDIGSPDSLGMGGGSTSRSHAWELKTYWQHVEQYALDPNLIDSDFFEGRENLQGFYVALAYGLTDNLIGAFRYGHASRINDKLGTGGSNQDIPQINPINDFDIYQVDLTFRF